MGLQTLTPTTPVSLLSNVPSAQILHAAPSCCLTYTPSSNIMPSLPLMLTYPSAYVFLSYLPRQLITRHTQTCHASRLNHLYLYSRLPRHTQARPARRPFRQPPMPSPSPPVTRRLILTHRPYILYGQVRMSRQTIMMFFRRMFGVPFMRLITATPSMALASAMGSNINPMQSTYRRKSWSTQRMNNATALSPHRSPLRLPPLLPVHSLHDPPQK